MAAITGFLISSAGFTLTDAPIDHLRARAGSAIANVFSDLVFVPLMTTPIDSATGAAMSDIAHTSKNSGRARVGFQGQVEPEGRFNQLV